ncbi:hypothetical protein [Paenibacillus sp. OV219]|uniref:hypothetical protein n=1 Tax=Paenibacillus sp. OV219 TaxID=1884377 RepID=UPI0008D3B223|nr:hypothetical protein [Paenibacillus sp. OV219]SEO63696.1 hypothetical protein SAMN05518847_10994 [Paenibacillus sp. OV219]
MFKNHFIVLLSLLIALTTGTVASAQSNNTAVSSNPSFILSLDEELNTGEFTLKLSSPITIKQLEANFSIPNKKITWYTEYYGGTNKYYYGVMKNVARGSSYKVKLGGSLVLGKKTDANLLWSKDYIFGELGFYPEIGKFAITTYTKVSVDQLKNHIKANGVSVIVGPGPENDGMNWILTVPDAKSDVNYVISFSKPVVLSDTKYMWKLAPVTITDSLLDKQGSSVTLKLTMEEDRELTLEDFIVTAERNGSRFELQHVTYKDGVITFSPVTDLAATDYFKIIIAGAKGHKVYGYTQVRFQ